MSVFFFSRSGSVGSPRQRAIFPLELKRNRETRSRLLWRGGFPFLPTRPISSKVGNPLPTKEVGVGRFRNFDCDSYLDREAYLVWLLFYTLFVYSSFPFVFFLSARLLRGRRSTGLPLHFIRREKCRRRPEAPRSVCGRG